MENVSQCILNLFDNTSISNEKLNTWDVEIIQLCKMVAAVVVAVVVLCY